MTSFQDVISIVLGLMHNTAVIMIVAYFVTRTRFYSSLIEEQAHWQKRLILILIFGALSVYGTIAGIKVSAGGIANIRDMGPMIAGLIGGPWAGLGAGLIGGVHRYTLGGATQLACSLSTVLAGLLGGLIFVANKRKVVGILTATLVMAGMELFHNGLALVISPSFETALGIVKSAVIPMVLANSAGVAMFFYLVQNMEAEKELIKSKQLMEGELKVARDIQMSIIPRSFPAYPDRSEFEIHALLEPAREVGGDFYDFFFIDDNRLFFVIGDVSGKGVPASLFMAVTRTLLRSKTQYVFDAHEIMFQVNNELCRENDSAMFVTIFCGIMDIKAGHIQYCNGGHNPPFLLDPGGAVSKLQRSGDMALGVMEDYPYRSMEFVLRPGECLVMYTDGITEAMNQRLDLFTEDRAMSSLAGHQALSASELVALLKEETAKFEAGAAPADDVTIMAIKKNQ